MNICAIVETRKLPNIRAIAENHVMYSGFKPMVFHGHNNEQHIQDELNGIDCLFGNIGVNELTASGYNRLLTSNFFWNCIPSENVLIFQHDSLLLRTGIEEYMQYDFIGAPIGHIQFPCMNGGLSLRKKSKMMQVIAAIKYNEGLHGNEDMFFCNAIKDIGGNLPTKEIAQSFSVETIFGLGSMGVHAIEKYLTNDQCSEILNQYNG